MTGLTAPDSGSSLSESYIECIQSFGKFVLALDEKDCRVIHLEQVDLPEILEEYGRIKIWGDQTKADLPARARGSLDDTLRHEDELKCLVQAILMRLRGILGQGKSYNSGQSGLCLTFLQQHISRNENMTRPLDRTMTRSAVSAPTRILTRIRMTMVNTNTVRCQRSGYLSSR